LENISSKWQKYPQLNRINYIWVTNLINDSSEEMNSTVEELLEWIKTGQVEANRKLKSNFKIFFNKII